MFKGFSRFKAYAGSFVIILSSLVLIGCAKKVAPVTGSAGLAQEKPSSSSSPSSQGDTVEKGLEQSSAEKRVDPDVRSEDMASSKGSESGGRLEERPAPKSGEDMASLNLDNGMASKGDERGSKDRSVEADMSISDLALKFASDIYFDFDVWTIRSDAQDALAENARWLVENTHVRIQIEGHGDERGTNEYNLALGERRARSTMRYLTNLGVSPSRISFISYGEEKNVCNEKTEDCFQKNRRAHFVAKK